MKENIRKEYNGDGELEFEGEYLYGKEWDGKGYNLNNNIEYVLYKGKGYVKKYYNNGILMFEGEYLNGKRNGKGKEYYRYGKLEFEGEYLYDQKRKGKLYINNKLEYNGEYLYNKKWNGKGYDENGNIIPCLTLFNLFKNIHNF